MSEIWVCAARDAGAQGQGVGMLAHIRYRFGDFTLDLKRGSLFRGTTEVKLRPKSFGVLQALIERHGELVTKDELLERVWGRTVVTDGVITQCLIDVRRAIGDESQEVIRTLPRRGYVFAAPVSTADDQPARVEATQSAPGTGPAPAQSPEPAVAAVPASTPAPSRWSRRMLTAVLLLPLLGALLWWAAASRQPAAPAAASDRAGVILKSIAVLPFVNLTGEPDGEYVADGIADEILHLLAQGDGLRVIARTSSFAFKGRPTSIEEIAGKLHVDYVVEGSVRRSGTNLRVNAQLIESSSSSPVWSKAYERDVGDLLAVQQDIAQHIATALQSSLRDNSRAERHVPDPAAHDAFLRARFYYNRRMDGDIDRAEAAYRDALRLDPRLARAWAGLAGVYGLRLDEKGANLPALRQKQHEAIDAAIALDPELAEARMRAAVYYFQIGDVARAKEQQAMARKLAPDDPLVLASYANEFTLQGRFDEAIEIEKRIVASDPVSRVARVNLATSLLAAGRLDEARAEFLNFVAMGARPDPEVTVELARIDLLAGRYPQAIAAAEQWPDGPDRDFVLAVAGDALGRHDAARAAQSRLLEGNDAADAVRLAELHAHRGDGDEAFRWLNFAFDRLGPNPLLSDQWQWVYQLKLSPFLKPLHADARWLMMNQRLGVP
jgi:TolB-like protein/DNA-binding winged helix-turn-helix (wHTH) protein/Tfp pilus assembly protein PilF